MRLAYGSAMLSKAIRRSSKAFDPSLDQATAVDTHGCHNGKLLP